MHFQSSLNSRLNDQPLWIRPAALLVACSTCHAILFLNWCCVICFHASFSILCNWPAPLHSVPVLILSCELICELQSDYIHVLLKSHSLFKMAFADPCSRGLIIYVDFIILILSGQPLFSICFMITYTSQVSNLSNYTLLMNNIRIKEIYKFLRISPVTTFPVITVWKKIPLGALQEVNIQHLCYRTELESVCP